MNTNEFTCPRCGGRAAHAGAPCDWRGAWPPMPTADECQCSAEHAAATTTATATATTGGLNET